MKYGEKVEILFSSLFFLLALFTLLVMSFSNYADNFKQLFMLVNKNRGVYASILNVFAILGIFLGLFFLYIRNTGNLLRPYRYIIMAMIGLFFLILILSMSVHLGYATLPNSLLLDPIYILRQGLAHFIDSYFGERMLDNAFLILFALLPILALLKGVEFDRNDSFGRIFYLLRPSLNVVIITIFTYIIHPVVKNHWWEYWEVLTMMLALVSLGMLFYRKPKLFGFYERFNLVLLILCVFTVLLGNGLFHENVDYYETKKTFYTLVLLGWSVRCMERMTR